jgi:hypothetical protein
MDLARAGHADTGRRRVSSEEIPDDRGDVTQDGGGAAARFGGTLGPADQVPVRGDGAAPEPGAADVDADQEGYAFFSSSFLDAADTSSALVSVTPFLNSLTLDPSDRASSGSRLAPKRISTMRRMMSNSW